MEIASPLVRLLPGLTREELDEFHHSLAVPPSDDLRDLLQYCSGMEGMLEQIDFTRHSPRSCQTARKTRKSAAHRANKYVTVLLKRYTKDPTIRVHRSGAGLPS
jgi:hypothetical protein